jgi:hypothetical protein
MTRHALVVFSLLGLFTAARASAQEPALSGRYAVANTVTWAGDDVVVDLTIELANEGDRPALNAQVTIEPPDASLAAAPSGTEFLARLNGVDIQPGARVRLTSRVTLPAAEWSRWQQRSESPNFRVGYHDDVDGDVAGPLRLARVGDIPD